MGERCMCVFTGCSHTCVKCVFFFFFFLPGPDCMCMFSATVRCMCELKALTLFFSPGMAPLLSAPQCPDSVTVSLKVFLFQFSSSLVQASTPPSISLFIPNSLPRFFFPPSLLPDSQAAAVPNSLALHFFKATFKKTS